MSCNNKCSSYFINLGSAARQNHKERTTVVQGDFMKVNVMCIPIGGEIGMEIHEKEEQLVTVVHGNATVKFGETRYNMDCIRHLTAGESVFIPAGTWHNICNTGTGQLKLISAYAHENEVCTRGSSVAGAQSTGYGCMQSVSTGRSNVFNATDYNWSTPQTQDGGCSCQMNSGC